MEKILTEAHDNEQRLLNQFNSPEKIDFDGDALEVTDIAPENLKTNTVTLVVPGFSATPEALKDAIIRIAQTGRRVVSVKAPHGIDAIKRKAELPEAEARKLEALLQVIEKKGIDKMNVIANSEASIYVTAAATLSPEKFENIVFIEPAGLIGKDNFLDLLKRFVQDLREQVRQDKLKQKVKYPSRTSLGATTILSDLFASTKEINAIAHSDITEALKKIHKQGIGISIIHAVYDKVFPMERVGEMVTRDMIDGFYSVQGTHNSIFLYEPFGRAAELALGALEKKKESQKAKNLPTSQAENQKL